jgi:hypothetical protein
VCLGRGFKESKVLADFEHDVGDEDAQTDQQDEERGATFSRSIVPVHLFNGSGLLNRVKPELFNKSVYLSENGWLSRRTRNRSSRLALFRH